MTTRLIIRLTAPVVASSLLLLAVGVGAAWYVHDLERSVSKEIRTNVSSVRAAEEVEIDIREIRTRLDRYLLTGDRKSLEAIAGFQPETDHWLTEAERWSNTDGEQAVDRSGCDRVTTASSPTWPGCCGRRRRMGHRSPWCRGSGT